MKMSISSGGRCSVSLAIAFILSSNLASAQGSPGEDGERHFDARIEHNQALRLQQQSQRQAATQPAAIASLKANIQDLTVEMDDATGAVRSLANQAGFLTDATRGEPMAIAMTSSAATSRHWD